MLGGYDTESGSDAHRPGAPTRIPVPSLLRSLLSEHLDPGYAAAAQNPTPTGRLARWSWQLVGVVVVAAVFAVAWSQAQATAPGMRESQRVLLGSVRAAEQQTAAVAQRRDELATGVDAEQRGRLEGDTVGRALLAELDEANFAGAATPVIGPGLTITVTDPGMTPDLTDVATQRIQGSRQVILDRDLQLVVNSLWVSGAEAIAVGGVRVGPNVTIRQAGGGILVDNQPVSSPYVVLAIGPPRTLQDNFNRSSGLQRLRLLETSYGVGVQVSAGDGLTLPAGSVREVDFATEMRPR